jgi:hypothetical protein
MEQRDIIWNYNLDYITEISIDDYNDALIYLNKSILKYSRCYSARIVSIDKKKLHAFIENIFINKNSYFDYVIEDFDNKTGTAIIIYKNNYIYYTMYDDVFSNPFDFVKIKINNTILNRLSNLLNYEKNNA